MKLKSMMMMTLASFFGGVTSSCNALPMPLVPTEPIYFEPPIIEATSEARAQSCVQLDNAIRYLHPYRYSYKPGFYDDQINATAVSAVALGEVSVLGSVYLLYSQLVDEKEQRRMLDVEQHIAMIQQVKAEKHCFE